MWVDKLVNKLIRGKIIEIIVVIFMVGLSIPVWYNFDKRISKANVIDIDDYNLVFGIEDRGNADIITVRNDYGINKSFKVTLRVNKEVNIDNSSLVVNNKIYKLSDFEQNKKGSYTYFTIVTDYVVRNTLTYEVIPNLDGVIINYAYIFEENINF